MAVNWHSEVVEQLDFYWRVSLRPRLEGLTDDEYFWEPVPAAGRSGRPAMARSWHRLGLAGARPAAVHDDRLAAGPHRRAGPGHPRQQPLRRRLGDAGDDRVAGLGRRGAGLPRSELRGLEGRRGRARRGRPGAAGRPGRGPLRRAPDGDADPAHQPRGDAPRRARSACSATCTGTPIGAGACRAKYTSSEVSHQLTKGGMPGRMVT